MKKDWEIKKLKDICEKGSSNVNMKDLSNLGGNYPIYGASGFIQNVNFYHQEKEYIGIIKDGSGIGRTMLLPAKSSVIGTLQYILPKEGNSIHFINYALQSLDLSKYKQGAAIPHIYFRDYGETELVVPPLEEQKRIVKILDEKFAQLETIKTNAQTNLQNAKDLFQSQLAKAFSNTTWEKKKVSEISENLDSKRIPITKNVRKTGQYPYYGASGIVDYVEDYIFDGKFLLVSEDGANLLARTYPIAFIAEGKFWVNNHAHILSFKDEITMKFVELFFSNLDISPYVTGMAQPKFNQASLNNIEVPLPPLPEQKRIVKELDTLSEKVRQLQEIYTKQIANCDELKQAYLQKAFEGEL